MALDDDIGPTPYEISTANFSVSATGLVSRSLSLWIRKIASYVFIAAILIIYLIIHAAIIVGLFGGGPAIDFILTDPTSFAWIAGLYLMESSDLGSLLPVILTSAVLMVIGFIIASFVIGAIVKFALDDYGRREGDVSSSVSYSFAKLMPLIIVQFILGFIMNILLQPAVVLLDLALYTMDLNFMLQASLISMFLMVLYLYLSARLIPVTAVMFEEERTPIDSFKRSVDLTKGNFSHIVGGVIIYFIVYILVILGFGFIAEALEFVFGDIGYLIGSYLTDIVMFPLSAIFGVVLYRDLKSRSSVESQAWW